MPVNPNASYVGHYSKGDSAIPSVYNGMRMEVLDQSGELLFVADVQVLSETMIELVRTSELLRPDIADKLPLSVSIRGFNAYQNCGIHMDGTLSKLAQEQDSAWLVKNIDHRGRDAGRSFSRQPITAQAWVRSLSQPEDRWLECKVVNASAGGVCFRTPEPLDPDSRLSIRFRLRRGKEQPPLTIAIRRVTDRGDTFEYGTEFVDLTPEVDMIITRTIIALQNMQK